MSLRTRPTLPALIVGACLVSQAFAHAESSDYAEPPSRSLRIERDASSGIRARAPLDALAASMRSRGASEATVGSLLQVGSDSTSARHRRYEQRWGGLRIHGTLIKGSWDAGGALVHVVERIVAVPDAPPIAARIGEAQALEAALAAVSPGAARSAVPASRDGATLSFAADPVFHQPPTVTAVLVPQADGRLAHGFLVETWTRRGNRLHHTLVGGDGRVLSDELRTASDRYNVFPLDPATAPQVLIDGPGRGNAQSPAGWLGSGVQKTQQITGNNIHAYLDATANNAPDGGGSAVGGGQFTTAAVLRESPATATNRAVGVQNLFYLGNVVHDVLYRHGFDEAAGNFQDDNFGKGGLGKDALLAEAQDGGGLDNANFATPSDGARPRMQMYLWSASGRNALQRDGDLDADIVFHEYGHGLTWRMIGGMSGPLGAAVGEGASDALAMLLNGRDTVASYASGSPTGLRRHRYAGYPLSYADVRGAEPHDDGEVYAAAMWRLRELWIASGRSADQLLGVFVDGMNYTPSTPAFEDMRDGMLDAIVHRGEPDAAARCALVWKAFAQFGIGDGARARVSGPQVVVTPSTVARKTCER